MRKNCWFIFGAMLSTSLLAQQVTNPPPSAPIETPAAAPAVTNTATISTSPEASTNAPAAKSGKKKKKKAEKKSAPKKTFTETTSAPLVAGPATVVASNVNVRGKASLKGEIVGRVTKGQEVTVLEEIVHNNSAVDEPSAWAKILLPQNAHAWVNTSYIDAAGQTVKPKKLNVRSGPGENYSVIATLERGQTVKALSTKGDWTEVEPPTNAYAFIAAVYLKQEAPAASTNATEVAATTPMQAAPTNTTTVTEAPVVAAAPTEAPTTMHTTTPTEAATTTTATNATEMAAANTSTNTQEIEMVTSNTPEPVVQEPPPKRIVQREGIVRGTFSIQAPTQFELISPETGATIDYLYSTSPLLDLRKFKGLHIIVTGEEGLEERWGNTPVITIQRIQVP